MRRKRSNEESIHTLIAKYLDLTGLLWFHPPNGGFRRKTEAARFKKMGVKPGVPDIMIVSPFTHEGKWRPGLAIEVKSLSGIQSNSQKHWERKLVSEGWEYLIARSLEETVIAVESFYGERVKVRTLRRDR